MGIEVAVLAAIAVAGTAGKMYEENQAANAQNAALTEQGEEQKLQFQQKSLQNLDSVQKVLDAQEAMMTTTGTAFSSPSFNAVQRNTLNIGAKEGKNIAIEDQVAQDNIDMEKKNVKSKLYAQMFGDVTNLAFTAASVAGKAPTGAK